MLMPLHVRTVLSWSLSLYKNTTRAHGEPERFCTPLKKIVPALDMQLNCSFCFKKICRKSASNMSGERWMRAA